MNLQALIDQFRGEADDRQEPFLWSDADLGKWFTEAEQEACIRARLIHEADDAAVCEIDVTAEQSRYALHPSVLEITSLVFEPESTTDVISLRLTDRIELDRIRPGWRRLIEQPRDAIQSDAHIQTGCLPNTNGVLRLECYRLPLAELQDDSDVPEIAAVHHRQLVNWVLHRAYSRPDSETSNPNASLRALLAFERIFGLRPDADMMRRTRENRPHHNQAVW